MTQTALFLLVLLPFLGAFVAAMTPVATTRVWALLVCFCTFVLSLVVAIDAGDGPVAWGMEAGNTLVSGFGFGVRLSVDGISAWLLLLNTLLTPLCVLSVKRSVDHQNGGQWFYAWMLVLSGAINGCFVAGDALLFYFFFELTLVPGLILIGVWGGPDRRRAAGKFFVYTFAGSIFLLLGLIYLGQIAGSFAIPDLVAAAQDPTKVSATARGWLAAAFLVGFLVKTPVFPLHTWQANAYAQSPTPVTVMLAAVMSKLGTYGLLRLTVPVGFVGGNAAPAWLTTLVVVLCLISVVYGGLIAWVQKDMARVMAFSSVSHLAVCVLAIFSGNTIGVQGAVAYMLAHGLSTAALFFLIGIVESRTGTRDVTRVSGLFARMPVAGTLLVGFTMASIGLPLTAGFVGEFLSLQGVVSGRGLGVGAVAAAGIVLGAIYMLNLVAKIGFGPLAVPDDAAVRDVGKRDLLVLLPLAGAVLLLGVLPTPVLESFKKDVDVAIRPAATPNATAATTATATTATTATAVSLASGR